MKPAPERLLPTTAAKIEVLHMNNANTRLALRTLVALELFMVAAGVPGSSAATAAPGVFYVAVNGNDQWSGLRSSPNWTKSDGPFATVERAVTAAREWRIHSGGIGENSSTIYLGPGFHALKQPIVLRPEDSGLSLVGSSKKRSVLSGGRRITGWKKTEIEGKRLWSAEIPEVRKGSWYFHELWVNGRRAVRARYPNKGYLKIANLVDARPDWTKGQTRFRYAPGDITSWKTITEGEVVVMTRWVESRLPVFSVEEDQQVINFSKRSVFALMEGDLYYLEGTFEALDEPGEWYLDRHSGTLYYMPLPGESLRKIEAIAPVLTQVLRFEGRPEKAEYVDRVTLRGLDFSHAEWCFPEGFAGAKDKPTISPAPAPEVGGFGQAAIGVPGAVWGEGVRRSVFESCAFKDLGNYGLELGRGCQSNRITWCEFSDLGAGGIKLGETSIRTTESELARSNEIRDCQIHDGGKLFHSAIGVWIGQSPDNRIVHNVIHDFYYTGISIGWTWGYSLALASNNLVAFNHVHHIGVKSDGDGPILSDMGGIYTLGMQPGTKIINNLWHDLAGLRYGGWGIYFDEGSSGIVAESNVVYRTTHGGFHQHYGETNILRNNIFAFARDHQLQRTRVEPHVSFLFETNIVYFDTGAVLGGDWSKNQYQMDWNDYWDARPGANPGEMRFANASIDQWHERGHDAHSVIADPLFVAPEKDDFRFRSGSPALKLGFQPIDLGQVGPRNQ
jgi:hypothetical protein